MDNYAVVIEGLSALTALDDLPERVTRNASIAVNAAAKRAYAEAGRQIRRQINFPAGYVTGSEGRLKITQFAKAERLEARISGRRRPTSLARFARSDSSKGGITVSVSPGAAVRLPRAFFIRLRAGANSLDTKSNLGIAIRLPPGKRPRGSREGAKQIGKGLWLLYGPSVQQAFINRQGGGVAEDVSPEVANFLEREFFRLMDL